MLPKKKCKRCGHEWILRKERPTVCPACKSPYWNQDRILNFKDEDNMLEENLEKKRDEKYEAKRNRN